MACTLGWAFFKAYFEHLLFWWSHFADSHGMFLFAYNLQEPILFYIGIFTFNDIFHPNWKN